jgi:predicted nucleotidyltransferase
MVRKTARSASLKEALKVVRRYREALEKVIRVDRIYNFGSGARGDARRDSDIDVATISRDSSCAPIEDDLVAAPVRLDVDLGVEVHAFLPSEFRDDPPTYEIKRNGILV